LITPPSYLIVRGPFTVVSCGVPCGTEPPPTFVPRFTFLLSLARSPTEEYALLVDIEYRCFGFLSNHRRLVSQITGCHELGLDVWPRELVDLVSYLARTLPNSDPRFRLSNRQTAVSFCEISSKTSVRRPFPPFPTGKTAHNRPVPVLLTPHPLADSL